MERPAFISVKEFAAYRRVHPNTILRWIKAGRVPAEQPAGKYGCYAIPAEMIIAHSVVYPPVPDWPARPL